MKTNSIVTIAFLAALLIVSKEILAFLPNVELVTLLVIIYSFNYSLRDSILVVIVFIIVQAILYGFNDWVLGYFIAWPLLVVVISKLKIFNLSLLQVALIGGAFGLLFGVFFVLPYLMVSLNTAFSFYLRGLVFDLVHGVSNFIVILFLFEPLNKVFVKLSK